MKVFITALASDESWGVGYVLIDLSPAEAQVIIETSRRCQAFLATEPKGEFFGKVRLGFAGIEALTGSDRIYDCFIDETSTWASAPPDFESTEEESLRSEIHCIEYDVDGDIRLTALDKHTSASLESENLKELVAFVAALTE